MNEAEPIIRLRNVSKRFGSLVVLDDVSVDIYPGQTTVVIGPSGTGKTVLLKLIVGLLLPDRGEIRYRDVVVNRLGERKLAEIRRRVGFLFQGGALFDSMTVGENLCFPMVEHDLGTAEDRQRRCAEVLRLVGLDDLSGRFPEELSGGQRKRVALARAIVLDPELVLYDEPTTGLDPIRADMINALIVKLQRTLGATGVVVTHDMASARRVGDRVLMLHNGRFIVDSSPDRLGEIKDDIVARFIEGRASDEELEGIQAVPEQPPPARTQGEKRQ